MDPPVTVTKRGGSVTHPASQGDRLTRLQAQAMQDGQEHHDGGGKRTRQGKPPRERGIARRAAATGAVVLDGHDDKS